VQSKQASQCPTPTSEVNENQKNVEKKEPSTKPPRMTTSSTTETSEAQKTPESNNKSPIQIAASAKTETQSSEVVKCKDPAPVSGKSVDSESPSADQHDGKDSPTADQHDGKYSPTAYLQEQKTGISEVKDTSPDPLVIGTTTSPTIEVNIETEPANQSEHVKSTSVPQFEAMLSSCQNSTNASISMVPCSSTERLTSSTASPEPLRPARRIEGIKAIKRQPKGGWL
jgi:hypothetical protein